MIAAEIIGQVLAAGGQITADGPDLVLTAPRPLPADLLDRIKAHKPDIVKALGQPPASKRRGLGGYGTPRGVPPLGDCALARQIRAINRAASPAMLDDDPDPVPGDEASPCRHVSLDATPPNLSAEDLEDIAAGDIAAKTVQAFEQAAIAREATDLKEFFEERAGILEFDAGLPRAEAELEAARITVTYARNRGYLWASLRVALADYPVLLAQVPDRAGPVDALPLGHGQARRAQGSACDAAGRLHRIA
jgi:hypothetical protein